VEAERASVGHDLPLNDVSQVKEVSSGIEDRPDLALQVADSPWQNGAAGHPALKGDGRKLVHISAGPETEVGHQRPLILPEEVQRKPSADLDKLAGKGRPANPDQNAGDLRDDRRRHHPAHNLTTASVLMGSRKDKDLKIQLTEHRRNTIFVHGAFFDLSEDGP